MQGAQAMKRIAVFGGRDYDSYANVSWALRLLKEKHGAFTLIHGACPTGADSYADAWAVQEGVERERYPANWDLGRRAGPERNQMMASSGLDGAVGFPGGSGTADMAARLDLAGVTVWWPFGR